MISVQRFLVNIFSSEFLFGRTCGITPRFLQGYLVQMLMKHNQNMLIEKIKKCPGYSAHNIFE